MRITDHKTNGLNEAIEIFADERDEKNGNASHEYAIDVGEARTVILRFQHGPVNENGINGITNEVLLAIVIDRLRGFQDGPFKCRENAIALTKAEESLMWLKKRTEGRLSRGVEGTHKP